MDSHDTLERLSDPDVMLRVQWGSESAFAEIYERYYRRLLNFFFGMTRDVQMAEDLCHETFVRIWQLRARYSPSGSFAAYAFTVARHIWLEQCRRSRKQPRLAAPFAVETQDEPPASSERTVCPQFVQRRQTVTPANCDAPDELAHRSEVGLHVFAALDKLPEEQRMAFILRTVNGLPLDEIAAVMQCPVNTVRSRRLLAVRRLRELLQGLFVL